MSTDWHYLTFNMLPAYVHIIAFSIAPLGHYITIAVKAIFGYFQIVMFILI